MQQPFQIKTKTFQMLADTLTPVSIYLKLRDQFPQSVLLESTDYKSHVNSYSFVGVQPIASFKVENKQIIEQILDNQTIITDIPQGEIPKRLRAFTQRFQIENSKPEVHVNGLFGYSSFNAVQYFENIELTAPKQTASEIPDMYYALFQYIIIINHFKDELIIVENQMGDSASHLDKIIDLLESKNFATYRFEPADDEVSNITDERFMEMVSEGKRHCHLGNVFQIVVSRQFSRSFKGDDFSLYRALRSVNPSPYLFYFDFGSFKIFGSSPEAQIQVQKGKAYINPIAGTFRRTGNDQTDSELAQKLSADPKENAEHVMLVDLARNDLSRNSKNVKVEIYKAVEYYSHVIHLVSRVSGEIEPNTNTIKIMADSFPAGTLSGAPKYKALQLIDSLENQQRGYYGGCLGYIGFDGEINQAIMIRSFLSKNNRLFYQAGAGVVADSQEISELNEVGNKLAALRKAIEMAKTVN